MEISPKPPKPRASIALVAYNQQDTIVESVNSILNQDGKDLEILLSDDCSSDGTYNLIEKAYKQYKGPHLLKINRNQYNMGIGAHVHHAASLTSGDYIVMASGDDLSLPNRVKKSLAVVEREGEMGVVVGRYHPFTDCFTDKNDWQPHHARDEYILRPNSEDWFNKSRHGKLVGIPGVSAMWNRKLFSQFEPIPHFAAAEDIVLANRCLIAGLSAGFTKDKFVLYRTHAKNFCAGVSREEFERKVLIARTIGLHDLKYFKNKRPDTHTESYWRKIQQLIESTIFTSIIDIRASSLRPLRGTLLSWLGNTHIK